MMKKIGFIILCFLSSITFCSAQEEIDIAQYNNQISTNLVLPLVQSFDLSYERTVANKWAIGLSGAIYGEGFSDFSTDSSGYYDRITNYEITPFVRFYLNGAQKKSHFFEFFGSIAEVDESGGYLRNVNEEGYGVYSIGAKTYTVGGLGAGYGYRFLLLKKKMVLEAQLGIRTNFNVDFFLLNGALVRTGIKVGYRF